MKKNKTKDIEIWNMQFSRFEFLSEKEVQDMNRKRKHIQNLSSLITTIAILLVMTMLIDNYKYSEYILFIIGLITTVTATYITISKIKTKKAIKSALFSLYLSNNNQDRYKVKIYYKKFLDRAETISTILIFMCALIALIRSIFLIVSNI